MRLSFRADRSGDVLVTLKPGYIWNYSNDTARRTARPSTTISTSRCCSSAAESREGTWSDEVAPTFLAKTIGALVGVDAGGTETRVLPCVK